MSASNRLPAAHRGVLVVLVAAVAVIGAATALRTTASAQDSRGRTVTFTELDKGSTFTHIRNTKTGHRRANSQGDLLALTNPLADASGTPIGKLHASCTTTVGALNFVKSTVSCTAVFVLRDGTVTAQAVLTLNADTITGAVTGGTGAYAGARGVFVSRTAKGGSADTVTLLG